MSQKYDTVLRAKSMLQVDPCNTAFTVCANEVQVSRVYENAW